MWIHSPALLGLEIMESGPRSPKAILSSERSLRAHEQDWMRAQDGEETREGAEEGHLNGGGF